MVIFKFIFFISGGVVLMDQITKLAIQKHFQLHESLIVVKNLVSLTYIRNPGAAFGILAEQSATFRSVFFAVVSVLAFFLLMLFFMKTEKKDQWERVALSLLLGGTIGNLIDRIRLGEVVDFIYFYTIRFPAFNVADSAITIGAFILLFNLYSTQGKVH